MGFLSPEPPGPPGPGSLCRSFLPWPRGPSKSASSSGSSPGGPPFRGALGGPQALTLSLCMGVSSELQALFLPPPGRVQKGSFLTHPCSPESSVTPCPKLMRGGEEERAEEAEPHTFAITTSLLITSDGLRAVWGSTFKITLRMCSMI